MDLDWQRLAELLGAAVSALGLQKGARVVRRRRALASGDAEALAATTPDVAPITRAEVERLVTAVRHDAVEAATVAETRLKAALDSQHAKVTRLYEQAQEHAERMSATEQQVEQQSATVLRLDVADRARERELGGVAARLDSMDASLSEVLRLLREERR